MAKIDVRQFGGKVPRVSSRLLQDHQAQEAINCEFDTGKLVPVKDPTQVTDHSTAVPKTLFKMGANMIIFPDGEENTVVDNPVDDTNYRIMWTDGVMPKQSNDVLWGEATWWRRLGVKPGAVAPTVTVSGAAGDDVQDYVSYVFTMVDTWGAESAPSPASAVATIKSDQYVDLSVMTTPSTSYNTYEYKRIYRLATGTQGAEYQYLAQIAYANTTFQDKATGNALKDVETDVIETEDWALPPDTLKGLTPAHNGMFIGYDGKELYISEPNYAYAWPTDYVRTFDTDIQGVGTFNQYIVVITTKYCYVLTGSHPLSMVKSKMGNSQGCLHDRGVVSTEFGVLYPSPDGLCLCDGRKVSVLSKKWISKTDWLALNPDTLVAKWHDNKYYGFFQATDDGLVYDVDTGEFATLNFETPLDKIYDIYVDHTTDTLSVLCTNTAGTNGYTYTIQTAATHMDYTWTSKIFVDNESYNCVLLTGNFGVNTVVFKYYEDGVLTLTKSVVAATGLFRLPDTGYTKEKYFTLTGKSEVYRVQLATAPGEID